MSETKSKLAIALIEEQRANALTDRNVADQIGVSQQTYNAWKAGHTPRKTVRGKIGTFLRLTLDEVDALIETEPTKEVPLRAYSAVRSYGRIADRKDGKFKFDSTRKAVPEGRYALVVDTKVMEPALRVGCKVWLDPGVWPRVGDEVVVHAKGGVAWIGQLAELGATVRLTRYAGEPVVIENIAAVHVVVLAERV